MQTRTAVSPYRLSWLIGMGKVLCALALAGCATPPPPQGNVEAFKRVRFEDSPAGARAILDDAILFKHGETTFASEADPVFDVLKPVFDRARGQVIVEGHTDTSGAAALNLKLSQERAEKVRGALIARRVSPSRVVAKGYGAAMLKRKPELNEADARANRRAEIVFVGETVASLNAQEAENKANSTLDELGKALKNAGKTISDSLGGIFGSGGK